ncbi:1037_t:CDS:2, partial [Racocetra fulgida]
MNNEYSNDMELEPENVLEPDDALELENVLEPDDALELENPDDIDLDELESNDTDGNEANEDSLQSSALLQTGNQILAKKRKKMKGRVAFKRIIEELDTQATVLSKDHLKDILINSEDKMLRNFRECALDSAEISYISFTTDMWTSSNGDPYIGLTFHWINDSFEVKEIIGNISYLPYPYTSECFLNKIIEILDSFKLKHITVSVEVNDNSLLRSYEEKELSSNEWEKVAELVKLLYPYEDMQIFTENKKNQTISEVRIEYLKLAANYYELDKLSDTASNDIMNEDIFSNPVDNPDDPEYSPTDNDHDDDYSTTSDLLNNDLDSSTDRPNNESSELKVKVIIKVNNSTPLAGKWFMFYSDTFDAFHYDLTKYTCEYLKNKKIDNYDLEISYKINGRGQLIALDDKHDFDSFITE